MSTSILSPVRASPSRTVPLLCDLTIVGIAVYVALDVVAQLLPPHYSPIGQPESGFNLTAHGTIHLAAAAIAFLCIPIAEEALSRSLLSAPGLTRTGTVAQTFAHLTVLGFVILLVFALVPNIGGLGERIFLASALLWMLVVALRLRSWPDSGH